MPRPLTFLFSIFFGHETPLRVVLLMQAEGAINGSNIGDGMLVDENVPLDLQKDGEIVERLDIPLHLVAGHELYDDLNPLLA
jgi:hypothetical protein